MVVRTASAILIVLGLVACSKPLPAPAAPVVKSEVRAPTVVATPRQAPSQGVLSRWNAPASPEFTAYGDLGALLQTELFQGLVPGLTAAIEAQLPPQAGDCILQWAGAVREVIFAANEQEGLAVISYDADALKTPVQSCIESLFALTPVEVADAKAAYAVEKAVLAIGPNVIVLGTRALVERSLSGKASGEWPKTVALAQGQQLAFIGEILEDRLEIGGHLSVANDRFVVHTEVTFPTVEGATAAAASASPKRLQQEILGENPQMKPISDLIGQSWFVEQTGQQVAFEVRVVGDPTVMAERLGMGTAMAIYGVRKYVVAAKISEARIVTRQIATRLVEAKLKRFTSLPAVPAKFEAVQGQKYQSAPGDWAKWQAIQFSLQGPQYFQYRVEAAKGGKAATVIAEGDLDANGKRSRFALAVEPDPMTRELRVAETLSEQDAME